MFQHPSSSTHYAFPAGDAAQHMWFESDNTVQRINYSGENLGTRATITSGPLGNLTRDANGNIWYAFTSTSPNPAGVVHTYATNSSGAIVQEYQLPGTGGGVGFPPIVFHGTGTDMWVGRGDTDANGAIVGGSVFRIRSGQVQQVQIQCYDVPVFGGVTPDGNIWIVGSSPGGFDLDVIDPATQKCVNTIKVGFTYPESMTVGPDGNIWVLDNGSNGTVITRVNSKTYARSNFGVGLNYTLKDIVAGPDGNLWTSFTNSSSTGLFKVSTSGTVLAKIICPTSVCQNQPADNVTQLTAAPDGNIWFAYNGTDVHAGIGSYNIQAITVTPSPVTFTQTGQTQTITISEANYSGGTWKVASANTSVVQVESRPAANQAVLKSTGPGRTYVAIYDTKGNYYELTVTVP